MTAIEWTEQTWNPIVGCTIATPGCTNCYAMKMANRLSNNPATPHYAGTVKKVNGKPVWTGKITMAPDRVLTAPLRRKKPTTYFVNSMGDLFHEDVPYDWIDRVFAVMTLCPQHTFQVLTKRAERMREYCAGLTVGRITPYFSDHFDAGAWPVPLPLPNVWLGVSVEDQTRADERIQHLLATPAAVRFISAEPLLGPINLEPIGNACFDRETVIRHAVLDGMLNYDQTDDQVAYPKLDWVIVGGESGPGARPMHPDWARSLRDQCEAAGVPFFFKQHGGFLHESQDPNCEFDWADADDRGILHFFEDGTSAILLGKKVAGRTLDGVVHDGRPG